MIYSPPPTLKITFTIIKNKCLVFQTPVLSLQAETTAVQGANCIPSETHAAKCLINYLSAFPLIAYHVLVNFHLQHRPLMLVLLQTQTTAGKCIN